MNSHAGRRASTNTFGSGSDAEGSDPRYGRHHSKVPLSPVLTLVAWALRRCQRQPSFKVFYSMHNCMYVYRYGFLFYLVKKLKLNNKIIHS